MEEDVSDSHQDIDDHDPRLFRPERTHVLAQTVRPAVQAGRPIALPAHPADEAAEARLLQHHGQPPDEVRPDEEHQQEHCHQKGHAQGDVDQPKSHAQDRGDPRDLREEEQRAEHREEDQGDGNRRGG